VQAALAAEPIEGVVHVVALGKAAADMALGAADALGARLSTGLVVSRQGYLRVALGYDSRFTCIEAGHPLPDARSLHAGRALLDFIARAPHDAALLFLISGGASSLVEVLPEGVTLADLREINQWLLGSGLDIASMNRVRARFSRIKGGQLATHLDGRRARVLLISDVPGDDMAVIGSGLLAQPADCPDGVTLPPRLAGLAGAALRPAPGGLVRVEHTIIARNRDALAAAAQHARALGHPVTQHDAPLAGDAGACGARIACWLREEAAPGIHLWGGECTVRLPAQPGWGGRSQQLALAAAAEIAGDDNICLLAAGTDGSDGNTDDAGALVDGGSLARGELAGLDARVCLAHADAGGFLEASGDLIHTGPTGTNVMDIVIGWRA
jgi:hydroxypyruvate reductase